MRLSDFCLELLDYLDEQIATILTAMSEIVRWFNPRLRFHLTLSRRSKAFLTLGRH
jgi:hypothetical protein